MPKETYVTRVQEQCITRKHLTSNSRLMMYNWYRLEM